MYCRSRLKTSSAKRFEGEMAEKGVLPYDIATEDFSRFSQ